MTGYRINIPPVTELHRLEIELRIKMLRALPNTHELWFTSRQQIIDYLNEIGVRTGWGRTISANTLGTWHRKRGFPMFMNNKLQKPLTSNIMIQAWLWAYRAYQATRERRPSVRFLPNLTECQANDGIL